MSMSLDFIGHSFQSPDLEDQETLEAQMCLRLFVCLLIHSFLRSFLCSFVTKDN